MRSTGCSVVMVGSKPEKGPETARKAVQKLGNGFVLKILDDIEHDELLEEVSRADIFVMPSLAEGGNPISLMEAMSFSKPCIASDVGGIRDLIKDRENGLLMKPHDPFEELADLILLLHSDPHLARRLGRNARKTVERFTWARTVKLYSAVYEKILRRG